MTTTVRGGVDPGVNELIDQTAEAAGAWMRGDIDRYLDLTHHAPGFTLTAPNGGPPVQFADRRSEFEGWQAPSPTARQSWRSLRCTTGMTRRSWS